MGMIDSDGSIHWDRYQRREVDFVTPNFKLVTNPVTVGVDCGPAGICDGPVIKGMSIEILGYESQAKLRLETADIFVPRIPPHKFHLRFHGSFRPTSFCEFERLEFASEYGQRLTLHYLQFLYFSFGANVYGDSPKWVFGCWNIDFHRLSNDEYHRESMEMVAKGTSAAFTHF